MAKTVFIVDDSEIVLSVSKTVLEQAGYRVLTQSRASRCLPQILLERPALVLLDVNMPDLPGSGMADLCKKARSNGVMVVLYSSLDAKSLRRLVNVSGADNFIQKTESPALLVRQVKRLLGEGGDVSMPQPMDVSATDLRHSGTHPKATSYKGINVLLVDRDMATLSMMRQIVQKMGSECEFALSTKQALDKLTSARPPDVVVVSDDLPQSGLLQFFESAVATQRSWATRFVITTGTSNSAAHPPAFVGPIVKKPVSASMLQAAIEGALHANHTSGTAARS